MTVNDDLFDLSVRHQVNLDAYEAGVVRRIIALLNRVQPDIVAQLQTIESDWSLARLDALLEAVAEIIGTGYSALERELVAEVQDFADYEAEYQEGSLSRTIPVDVDIVSPSREQIRAAAMARPFQGRLLREWAKGIDATARQRVRDAVRIGFVEGEPASKIVQRVRGTRARKYEDGILQINRRDAEAVIRTAVAHTAAVARAEVFEANDDIIKAVRWVSTLDGRTSAVCVPAETEVMPAGRVLKAFRRWFEGEIVTITTAAGKKVRATPNHPVLTTSGWLPIAEIKPGQQVINAVFGDAGSIVVGQDVCVPSPIGAIFDAVNKPSVSHVFSRGSSTIDFHGDGMGEDYQIDVADIQCDLRNGVISVGDQQIKNTLLGGDHLSAFFPSDGLISKCVGTDVKIDMAPKFFSMSIQEAIQPAFGPFSRDGLQDAGGHHSFLKESNGCSFIGLDELVSNTSSQCNHNTSPLEESGHCGCGCSVLPADTGSTLPVGVFADDVVSVSRENTACHVFNLETSLGYYIADGLIVKNCRARDGQMYPVKSGPRPPAHFRCRSTVVPITKSYRELGLDIDDLPEATRASMNGQVPGDQNYDQWLRKQPEAFQNEVLGAEKAKLFREGLTMDRFVTRAGRELTLAELRALEL